MTRDERKEQADMRDEYHAMEERVAALEEERDKLRKALKMLLEDLAIFRPWEHVGTDWAWHTAKKALEDTND